MRKSRRLVREGSVGRIERVDLVTRGGKGIG